MMGQIKNAKFRFTAISTTCTVYTLIWMACYLTVVETKELESDASIIPCSNPPEHCEADGDCEHIKGFCGFFPLWSDTKLCVCPPPTFENNHVEDVLLSLPQNYYPITEPVPIIVLCDPKKKCEEDDDCNAGNNDGEESFCNLSSGLCACKPSDLIIQLPPVVLS